MSLAGGLRFPAPLEEEYVEQFHRSQARRRHLQCSITGAREFAAARLLCTPRVSALAVLPLCPPMRVEAVKRPET